MADKRRKSTKAFKKAQNVIPGGVNSPARAFSAVEMDPIFIEKGEGAYLYDIDGNKYIDYVNSWGPMILGHAHDEVLQAVTETAARGTSFGAPTVMENELAEKIIEMVPSVEMVRMVNSGTEATMSAIRVARGFTGRDKIIKFAGCYHGHGDSFLIKAGSGALTLGEPDSPGVPASVAQNTLTAEFNDLDSVETLFQNVGDDIACVIVEPIAGNMGVIPPNDGFLQGLRNLCDQHGSLLIFDEVMTGFRVAPGGAQEIYGVMPDITTMGKVIGGGLPAAAYGGRREIMNRVAPAGPIYQAGTLSGNPLAVAAGLTTLQLLSEPGFYQRLNEKANKFFKNTQTFIQENNLPLSLNWVNSMGCLYFKSGGVENFTQATESDTQRFAKFFGAMLDAGLYIAPSQFEAMFISSAHTEEDLAETTSSLSTILSNLVG